MTDESRFSRWSRMKTKSRPKGRGIFFNAPDPELQEEEIEETSVAALQEADATAPPEEADTVDQQPLSENTEPEEEEPYPEDLPPIESLNKDSDFTAFMSDRVSDKIRNAALRKLWISNPALANLDGLLDYGEDLTGSFKVVENMQSVYKVGRGMVDYEAEAKLAEEKAREKEEAEQLAAEEAEQQETEADDSAPEDDQPEEIETTDDAESDEVALEPASDTVEIPEDQSKNG